MFLGHISGNPAPKHGQNCGTNGTSIYNLEIMVTWGSVLDDPMLRGRNLQLHGLNWPILLSWLIENDDKPGTSRVAQFFRKTRFKRNANFGIFFVESELAELWWSGNNCNRNNACHATSGCPQIFRSSHFLTFELRSKMISELMKVSDCWKNVGFFSLKNMKVTVCSFSGGPHIFYMWRFPIIWVPQNHPF